MNHIKYDIIKEEKMNKTIKYECGNCKQIGESQEGYWIRCKKCGVATNSFKILKVYED